MRHRMCLVLIGAICLAGESAYGQCQETAKLTSPNGMDNDKFGWSAAIGAPGIVLGAPDANDNGAVEFFKLEEGTWTHAQTITAPDPGGSDYFGGSCAIFGDVLAVGAMFHNQSSGAVYVYRFDGFSWAFEQKVLAAELSVSDQFGRAIAIDGDRMVVGANGHDPDGAAYVFEHDGESWVETDLLLPSSAGPFGRFGFKVDIAGDVIVVSDYRDNTVAPEAGAAYVFRHTEDGFIEEAKLLMSDGAEEDAAGLGLATDGQHVVVGAIEHDGGQHDNAGAAYVFTWTGQEWIEDQKLVASDAGLHHLFGEGVAISDGRILIGASQDDELGFNAGAAYVFELDRFGSWTQTNKLLASDGESGDAYARGIDAYNGTIVAGAHSEDGDGGFSIGAAYVHHCAGDDEDTDGDGLLDAWETEGIPYETAGGQTAYYVLDFDGDGESDADPNYKDLFVELDHMATLTFEQEVCELLQAAFFSSPVDNPTGEEGISLWILVDDDDIPFEEVTITPGGGWPDSAPGWKANYFGTDAERASPDAAAMLEAKAKAFRYGILVNKASESVGGLGELGGDDMMLFAGTYSNQNKASVFMHELGHLLGLHHGGGDDINSKPNYPSVMNYLLAYEAPWSEDFWMLDYSREQLGLLSEADLDETIPVGLGGTGEYDGWFMPYYSTITEGAPCFDEADWGKPAVAYVALDANLIGNGQDWNLDCDEDDTSVESDVNFLDGSGLPGTVDPSPGQTLIGHDDWASIVLPISPGGGAFAGPVPTDELTEAQVAYMAENFPPPPEACAADVNDDGVLNILDFVAFQDLFVQQDPGADCDANGQFNILDFVCFQALFTAGCP